MLFGALSEAAISSIQDLTAACVKKRAALNPPALAIAAFAVLILVAASSAILLLQDPTKQPGEAERSRFSHV